MQLYLKGQLQIYRHTIDGISLPRDNTGLNIDRD